MHPVQVRQRRDGPVRLRRYETHGGYPMNTDGVTETRSSCRLRTWIGERARAYEKRWAGRVLARGQHLDGRTCWQPGRGCRPSGKRKGIIGRCDSPKPNADRAPAAGTPEHPLPKLLGSPLQTRSYRDGRIRPHQLQESILELNRDGCCSLSIVAVYVRRYLQARTLQRGALRSVWRNHDPDMVKLNLWLGLREYHGSRK